MAVAHVATVLKEVNDMNQKNNLQKAIDQVGLEAVMKPYTPQFDLANCEMHGHYAVPKGDTSMLCPICSMPDTPHSAGNGETATEVEHYIDIKDAIHSAMGVSPKLLDNPHHHHHSHRICD